YAAGGRCGFSGELMIDHLVGVDSRAPRAMSGWTATRQSHDFCNRPTRMIGLGRTRMFEGLVATGVEQGERDLESPAGEFVQLDEFPTVVLSISSLLLADSPRQSGESDEHI